MKHILFTAFLLPVTLSGVAQNEGCLAGKSTATESRLIASSSAGFDGSNMVPVDSTDLTYAGNYGWDSLLKIWKYQRADIFEYDNGSYNHFYGIERIFNTGEQIISGQGEVWDDVNSLWLVEARDRFSYTTAGLIDTEVNGHYNGSSWDSFMTVSTYNLNNRLISSTTQTWNQFSSSWEDVHREMNTYSGNDLVLTVTENYTGGSWENEMMTTFIYNTNGDVSTSETKQWDGNAWQNVFKLTHTYNGNNERIQTIREIYSGGMYQNRFEFTRTFNSFHQTVTETRRSWNTANNQFEYTQGDYTQYFYYETYATGLDHAVAEDLGIVVYPVPAKQIVYIGRNAGDSGSMLIELYDMSGRQVAKAAGDACTNSMDISRLDAGIYMLDVRLSGKRQLQMISIMK